MQYRVSGKAYHGEDSDKFFLRVEAESVDGALKAVVKELEFYGEDEFDEEVAEKVARVMGEFESGAGAQVWVGDDRMFCIRSIGLAEQAEENCPHCHGTGKVTEYIPF